MAWIVTSVQNRMPTISFITEIELLCWEAEHAKDGEVLNKFVADATIVEMDKTIKEITISIRRKHKLKVPDAIIAATAISLDATLLTRNEKDFARVQGLRLENPFLRA